MNRIQFIEKREFFDPSLSKLFNIIVNYKGLNNPEEVGYCTKTYTTYFQKIENPDFNQAVRFFLSQKENLREKLISYQKLVGVYSFELINELKDFIENGDTRLIDFDSIKGRKQFISYKHKVVSLFWKNNLKETISKIKMWLAELEKFSNEDISEKGSKYLFNLLTIESMIGATIENDILKRLKINHVVIKNQEDEMKGIDAIVNGIKISIKSEKYLNSGYKRNSMNSFSADKFIIYQIYGENYKIINNAGFDF
jgi:hypothetical protein